MSVLSTQESMESAMSIPSFEDAQKAVLERNQESSSETTSVNETEQPSTTQTKLQGLHQKGFAVTPQMLAAKLKKNSVASSQ